LSHEVVELLQEEARRGAVVFVQWYVGRVLRWHGVGFWGCLLRTPHWRSRVAGFLLLGSAGTNRPVRGPGEVLGCGALHFWCVAGDDRALRSG